MIKRERPSQEFKREPVTSVIIRRRPVVTLKRLAPVTAFKEVRPWP